MHPLKCSSQHPQTGLGNSDPEQGWSGTPPHEISCSTTRRHPVVVKRGLTCAVGELDLRQLPGSPDFHAHCVWPALGVHGVHFKQVQGGGREPGHAKSRPPRRLTMIEEIYMMHIRVCYQAAREDPIIAPFKSTHFISGQLSWLFDPCDREYERLREAPVESWAAVDAERRGSHVVHLAVLGGSGIDWNDVCVLALAAALEASTVLWRISPWKDFALCLVHTINFLPLPPKTFYITNIKQRRWGKKDPE